MVVVGGLQQSIPVDHSQFKSSQVKSSYALSQVKSRHRQSFHFDTEDTGRTGVHTGMQIQHRSRAPGPPYNSRTRLATGPGREGDWGNFQYKKREISIQDIIIYHHISCCYHDISLCIIFSIMIYHVPRRIMIYRDIIFFFSPCDIMLISCRVLDDTWT